MFDSQQFSGSIDILLPALGTSHLEGAVDRRTRGEGVCLGKQDLVSEKEILPSVKPMVFAEHYPEIRIIFPHVGPSNRDTRLGRDRSGPDDINLKRLGTRVPISPRISLIASRGCLCFETAVTEAA